MTILLLDKSILLNIIPEFAGAGSTFILTFAPVCTPIPEIENFLFIVF
jgi:hypothetical protein